MVIFASKEQKKCYDSHGHPTSISDHDIIGFIAVWYIDITQDIVGPCAC